MPDLIEIKKVPIFSVGKRPDSEGNVREWTHADLDGMVANFKKDIGANYCPPVVLGHPKMDDPRYGNFLGVQKEKGVLFADIGVIPELDGMMKKGQYPDRSVRVTKQPDGTFRLMHLGLLGVVPPAVKDLPPYHFKEDEGETLTVDFSEWKDNIVARTFQKIREFIIEKWGSEAADKVVDPYDIEGLMMPEQEAEALSFAAAQSDAEKAKAAQEARFKKYGIGIKVGGNVTKPADYSNIPDQEFADPVNYNYPIDAGHCQAALGYWGMPKNRGQYTSAEVKIITGRILSAAKKHGIAVDETKWNFSAAPAGGSGIEHQQKEEDMEKVEQLEKELNEHKTLVSDFTEKQKVKDEELAASKKRIAILEAKTRHQDFAAFCDSEEMKAKITPAIRPAVIDFMEILTSHEEYEFAEFDDKDAEKKVKAQPLDRFKALLKALPKAVDFTERATKDRAASADGADEKRDKAISDFQESHKDMAYKDVVLAVSKKHPELFGREG